MHKKFLDEFNTSGGFFERQNWIPFQSKVTKWNTNYRFVLILGSKFFLVGAEFETYFLFKKNRFSFLCDVRKRFIHVHTLDWIVQYQYRVSCWFQQHHTRTEQICCTCTPMQNIVMNETKFRFWIPHLPSLEISPYWARNGISGNKVYSINQRCVFRNNRAPFFHELMWS